MAGESKENGFTLYVHPSNADFYNLDNDFLTFNIRPGGNAKIFLSKINLQSISTPNNPCLNDEAITGDSCVMKKVL